MDITQFLMSQESKRIKDAVECEDGFHMSVQASHYHYCSPRYDLGPWYNVEVGFPSEAEDMLLPFAEERDNPTETVYGYVPIEIVDAVIGRHGGIKNA